MKETTAEAMKVRPKYVDYSSEIRTRCVRLTCEILADKILEKEILKRKKVRE